MECGEGVKTPKWLLRGELAAPSCAWQPREAGEDKPGPSVKKFSFMSEIVIQRPSLGSGGGGGPRGWGENPGGWRAQDTGSAGSLPTPVCRHLRGERRVARDEWLDLLPPASPQPAGRREAAGSLAAPLAFSEPASKTVSRSTSQSAGDAERKPGLGTSSNRVESLPPAPEIGRKGSQVKLKEELGFHHKARADASEVVRPSASPFQKPKVEARVRWRLSPPLGGRCSAGPALGAQPRHLHALPFLLLSSL